MRNSRFATSIFTRTHIFSLDTLTLTNIRYSSSSPLLNFSHQVEDLFNKVQTLIPTLMIHKLNIVCKKKNPFY